MNAQAIIKMIGSVVLCYVGYALYTGRVMIRRGGGIRSENPLAYWLAIAGYAIFALALIFMEPLRRMLQK